MATESQELQLIVTAVDNASAVLAKTKRDLEDFGKHSKRVSEQAGGSIGEALKGITKFSSQLIGLPLGEFAKIAAEATRGIGGFTTALAAVPLAMWEVNESLKEFADRMGNLKVHAESIGLMTGEFEALNQQIFKMTGNMQTAQQTTSNLITWIARAQRMGTPERANIGRMFQNPGEVLANLGRLSQLGPEEQVKGVINMLRASEERQRQNLMQGFGGRPGLPAQAAKTQAATFTEEIARGIGLPADWREIDAAKLHAVTQKEIEDAKAREEAAKHIKETEGNFAVALEKLKDKILLIVDGPMEALLQDLTSFITDDPVIAFGVAMGAATIAFLSIPAWVRTITGLGGGGAGAAAAGGEAATGGLAAGGMIGAAAALALEEIIRGEFKEGRREATEKEADPDLFKRQLEDAQKGILPGDQGATVPKFQHGGIVRRPMMGLLGEAGPEAVIPLSSMSGEDASREQRKLLRENTEELRRLNDFLTRPEEQGGAAKARAAGGRAKIAEALGMGAGANAIQLGGGGGGGGMPGGALGGILGGLMGGAGGGAGGIGDLLGGILGGGGGGGGIGGLIGGIGGAGGGGGGGLGGILRSITGGGMGGLGGMPGGGGGGGGGIRRPGGGGGGGGGGDGIPGGGGGGPVGSLAEQRAKFAEELKNPETRRLLAASAAAEVGGQGAEATQSYIESVLNRASSRGKSLTATLRDSHYYPSSTTSKLDRPVSGAEQSRIDEITKQVTAGSNVSNFATGNESGGVHSGGAPVTRDFGRGRERFVQENADKKWVQRQIAAAGGGGGGTRTAAAGGGAAGGPNVSMPGDIEGSGPPGGRFNVPAGTPLSPQSERETVTLANGQQVTVNKRSAAQFKGFFNDLIQSGAPVRGLGGFGTRGNPSQHPTGLAVDWAQNSRDVVSPDVRKWIDQHRDELGGLEKKWGVSGGETWRHPDTGHFSIEHLYGPEHLAAIEGASRLARDGSALDQTHKIQGSANIDVNVNAPPGTNVRARSAGLFKQTRLTRQTQMPVAAGGPEGPAMIE